MTRSCPICHRKRQIHRPVCGRHWRMAPAYIALEFLEAVRTDPYDCAAPTLAVLAAARAVVAEVCDALGRAEESVALNPLPDPAPTEAPPS